MPIASYGFGVSRVLKTQAMIYVGGNIVYHYLINNNSKRGSESNIVCVETEDRVESVGNLLKARYHCEIQPWNSDVYAVIGGYVGNNTLNQTEWFDLRTGQSCFGPTLSEPRGSSMKSYAFQSYDKSGKQIGSRIIVIGGLGLNDIVVNSIEILETNDLVYVETPSEEITLLRWKKIFSSTRFISILILFISILVFALMYLLYQIVQIRKKSQAFARGKA